MRDRGRIPRGSLIYGHGFFGSLRELRGTEWISATSAQEGCFVFAATTVLVGMAQDDIPDALLALNDLNKGCGVSASTCCRA